MDIISRQKTVCDPSLLIYISIVVCLWMVRPFCSIVGEICSSSSTDAPSVTFDLKFMYFFLLETLFYPSLAGSQEVHNFIFCSNRATISIDYKGYQRNLRVKENNWSELHSKNLCWQIMYLIYLSVIFVLLFFPVLGGLKVIFSLSTDSR